MRVHISVLRKLLIPRQKGPRVRVSRCVVFAYFGCVGCDYLIVCGCPVFTVTQLHCINAVQCAEGSVVLLLLLTGSNVHRSHTRYLRTAARCVHSWNTRYQRMGWQHHGLPVSMQFNVQKGLLCCFCFSQTPMYTVCIPATSALRRGAFILGTHGINGWVGSIMDSCINAVQCAEGSVVLLLLLTDSNVHRLHTRYLRTAARCVHSWNTRYQRMGWQHHRLYTRMHVLLSNKMFWY